MASTSTKLRDPAALAGPVIGASFVAGLGGGMAIANSPYPRPGSKPAEIRQYFGESAPAARLSATGQAISTVALVRFTESVSAASGMLSPLYFVTKPAAWLIPAGRFSGLVVSGIAGARLSGIAGARHAPDEVAHETRSMR